MFSLVRTMEEVVNFVIGSTFDSIDEFFTKLRLLEKQQNCNYAIASSRALNINKDKISNDVKRKFKYKYCQFRCKMGGKPRGNANRQRQTSSYKQDCGAGMSIALKMIRDRQKLQIVSIENAHNHIRSKSLYDCLPKQRRDTIDEANHYLKHVVNVKPSYQLLQTEISTKSLKSGCVKRSDLHNFAAKNRVTPAGISDLDQMVTEMLRIEGSTVKVFYNVDHELEAVYFQDNRMKAYFEKYPDLLMFDGTFNLNDRRMPLVILIVIDGEGESQIAGFFIVKSENSVDLNNLFDHFIQENPEHAKTEVVLTDKHVAYHNVISNHFPNAVHHLCIFHVSQIFTREITTIKRNINGEQRKTCLDILNKMIYARSMDRYNELYRRLLDTQCEGRRIFIFKG